jgi:hypothetical protein
MTTLAVEAPATNGEFVGYLAGFNRDHGGDVIGPGAMDQTVADFRAGRLSWLLTDGHADPNDTSGVVAYVTDAELDSTGLRVRGNWLPTEKAQRLRQMATAGAPLGLSIDYLVDAWRPDGRGGRVLDRITVTGGAVVRTPMNSAARITESKGGGAFPASVPVVDVFNGVQAQAERNNPQRQAEDRMLEAASWPPPHFDRETRLALIRGAADAKAVRQAPADDGEARRRARWEKANEYSYALARTMATCKPLR